MTPLRAALAVAAGAAICASLPPWGWWPLAPLGVALWIHLLGTPSLRARFALGWLVGLGWFGPSTLWIWGLTPPGYVVGLLAGWAPLVGLVSLLAPPDRRRLLVLPAGVVLFEWFHTHAPFGGVPLSMTAMSQTRAPLLPVARLGGALLLGAAVCLLGAALWWAVTEREWRRPVAIVATIGVVTVVGAWWPTGTVDDEIEVALIQGGGPQGTRFSRSDGPVVFRRHLDTMRSIPDDADVDLVLWPENAINVDGEFEDSGWGPLLADEAERLDATVLVGIVEDDPDDPERFLNYVIAYEPDGTTSGRYDKQRRVPFGEYVPLRPLFEPIAGEALPGRDQTPGDEAADIETGVGRFAVAISWEVFFSRIVREGVREGGQVVLNPTNGSSYWLTHVQTQQIATSSLRAAESGRWLLQASPTGFTAVIDDRGAVLERSDVSEERIIYATVPMIDGTTPAQLLGDLPALAFALAAVAVAYGPRPRRVAAI